MALYLTEDDVARLLTMQDCIAAVEEGFRDWAEGTASNRPRARAALRGGLLHVLPAASDRLGRMAAKVYATTRGGARFVVLLFDGRSSEMLAVLEADRLGQIRTGAASGVATRHLARQEATILGILGSGWQARSQALAISTVRRLDTIRAWGRDPGRLRAFCREVEAACGVPAIAVRSPEMAVRGAGIVVTATSAAQPVLDAAWIDPGTHINAVGSNRADRRELEERAVLRADLIVVDSLEQARLEAGDLLAVSGTASEGGLFDRVVELAAVVTGRHPGRGAATDVTLFKSLGLGLEDLVSASLVYDLALKTGAGRPFPSPAAPPQP
ncbi:MAG TPA: ornithine cyclodeaminase family protein [Candidatus Polarisedimenticolia bacterium]|nr:ornithine cyclodeaminase family protein [Candidatus Polarisedimenticolia bacterium]